MGSHKSLHFTLNEQTLKTVFLDGYHVFVECATDRLSTYQRLFVCLYFGHIVSKHPRFYHLVIWKPKPNPNVLLIWHLIRFWALGR